MQMRRLCLIFATLGHIYHILMQSESFLLLVSLLSFDTL